MIRDELGIEDFDEKNLKCCCPFHNEDHASFIWNHKNLSFHCFGACGRNYDLIDVLMYKGMTYTEACQELFDRAEIRYTFGEHRLKTRRAYRYPTPVECDDKKKVYAYLKKRCISQATADYLDIRQDEHGNCVFNYYDENDTLTMVKYRPSRIIKKGENKNWCQKDADTAPLLFNMNRINPEQPLLICCGELDCAAAVEAGWRNAVSIPLGDQNLEWVKHCFDWLEQFKSIIICHDNDESGRKFCKNIIPMLGAWRTKVVKLPESITIEEDKPVAVKDLNEALFYLGAESVREMILNAQDMPVESVADLSDIEPTDYEDVDGVTFGLKSVDDELMRLFYGTLTVLSGRPGSGKSSIISQLICNALDSGINTWLYSGELPNAVEKSWFNYIFAGPRNVHDATSLRGNPYKKIPGDVIGKINQTYKGRWFIYKDACDNTLDSLIDSMTNSVRKFATKLLVLDNFMCIDTEIHDSELRAQTETIKRLINFARKYDCAVVLVAHPRKGDSTSMVGIDDIAGTSNIVNLAHRTIAMRRISEQDREEADGKKISDRKRKLLGYDVVMNIIKDRMFGRANIEIGLYYDKSSRRFYSNDAEYDRQFAWDKSHYDIPMLPPRTTPWDEENGDDE